MGRHRARRRGQSPAGSAHCRCPSGTTAPTPCPPAPVDITPRQIQTQHQQLQAQLQDNYRHNTRTTTDTTPGQLQIRHQQLDRGSHGTAHSVKCATQFPVAGYSSFTFFDFIRYNLHSFNHYTLIFSLRSNISEL